MSMVVERVSLDTVKNKLASLKRNKPSSNFIPAKQENVETIEEI